MNFDKIIGRAVSVFGLKTQADFAVEVLKIGANNLSNKKKVGVKGALLSELVSKIVKIHPEVNLHWLITGEGEQETIPSQSENIENEIPNRLEFKKAIDYLSDIFNSQDIGLINAITSNLVQLSRTTKNQKEIENLRTSIKEHERIIRTLDRRKKDMSPPDGAERRSGKERRGAGTGG